MQTITCVEDLREVYKRRVPKMFIDYAESGSYSEQTLHWNREDLQKITLAAESPDRCLEARHQDHDRRQAGQCAR